MQMKLIFLYFSFVCPPGSARPNYPANSCPPGTLSNRTDLTDRSQCQLCPARYACLRGASLPSELMHFIIAMIQFFYLHCICILIPLLTLQHRHWWHPETSTLLLCWSLLPGWHHVPHPTQVSSRHLEWSQWAGVWERVPAMPTRLVLSGWCRRSFWKVQLGILLPRR